ncbi:ABC transporter ATP-binding protein [Lachnospiraceae bacterium ZAX-1]
MELCIEKLNFEYASKFAITDVSASFKEQFTAIIGPNGSGKSTLLKCLTNQLKWKGGMYCDGRNVRRSDKDFFRTNLSYLPQTTQVSASVTVFEMVLMGLISELSMFVTRRQERQVEDVMNMLELGVIAHQNIGELSGGQLQMVLLAQAIIKKPKVLLLDEPLNNLDVHRKFALLGCIARLTKENNIVTVVVMHDINLASRYADSVLIMREGEVYFQGAPKEAITKEALRDVYRVESEIFSSKEGHPVVEFVGITQDVSCVSAV